MSGFTKTFSKTFDFDGDNVKVEMERLKVSDFRELSEFIELDSHGKPTGKMTFAKTMDFLLATVDILPKRVKSMEGLKDEGGAELSVDDIAGEHYFSSLTMEIFQSMLSESVIKDPKAPDEPSADSSAESQEIPPT